MNAFCDICWILLPSESHKTSHFNSEKHKDNYEFKQSLATKTELNAFCCEICCIRANNIKQLDAHMNSKNHFKKVSDRDFINDKFVNVKEEATAQNLTKVPLSAATNELKFQSSLKRNSFSSSAFTSSSSTSPAYSSTESISNLADAVDRKLVLKENKNNLIHKSYTFSGASSVSPTLNRKNLESTTSGSLNKINKTEERAQSLSNWCQVCYVQYTSPQNKEQHLNGQSHKKREEAIVKYKSLADTKNYCKVCYTMTNDKSQLERHLNSENHVRTIKQYIEFYNIFKSNPELNLPFKVDENQKLIENVELGEGDVISSIGSECINSTSRSLNNNNMVSVRFQNRTTEIKEINPIDFINGSNLFNFNSVPFKFEMLNPKWDTILECFENMKAQLTF